MIEPVTAFLGRVRRWYRNAWVFWSSFAAVVVTLVIVATSDRAGRGRWPSVTLFAAASSDGLCLRLEQLPFPSPAQREAPAGADALPPSRLSTELGSSGSLARQLLAGREADLFLSANGAWMDRVEQAGLLVPGSRRILMHNRLVLVCSDPEAPAPGPELAVEALGDFVIADPLVAPLGGYSRQVLVRLGWWEALQDELLLARDATSILAQLRSGRARYGLVYRSDLASLQGLRSWLVPAELHEPIAYWIAALRGRGEPLSQRWLDLIEGPLVRSWIRELGFDAEDAETVAAAPAVRTSSPWHSLLLSLQVALACCALALLPGVACGWLLARRRFAGKALVDALLHLPLVVPPVVTGYLLLLLLGPNRPVGGFVRDVLGIDLFDWKGCALASAVVGFPLLLRSARLAFEGVDPRLEEAARTLGARPWRAFRTVSLPLARPGILSGLVLCFGRSLGEFGATITFVALVEGRTDTLPMAIWRQTQLPGGEEAAVQLLVLSLVLALAAMLLSEQQARRAQRLVRGEDG